jgi:predicted flap endonuclease-1-like 5' DNA nuclease
MSELALDLIFIIIVLLGTAVLGILIGYVFGLIQKKKAIIGLEKQILDLKNERIEIKTLTNDTRYKFEKRIDELETELSTYQEEKDELSKRTKDLMKALAEVREKTPVADTGSLSNKMDSKKGGAAYNLKIIEGIGPKIEEILKQEGLDTWVKLSMANPDEIRSILISKGGSAYRVHDPRSWPYQAKLASEGLWKDLKAYQDKLSGGK